MRFYTYFPNINDMTTKKYAKTAAVRLNRIIIFNLDAIIEEIL